MRSNGFTATERLILDVLADGAQHKRADIMAVLDPYTDRKTFSVHLCNIRKKLPAGEAIICVMIQGRIYGYQHVRLICSSNDTRTG